MRSAVNPNVFATCVVTVCASSYADTHQKLDLVKKYDEHARYNRHYHVCPNCKAEFLTPEEQDKDVLRTEEYLTVLALQRAYVEKVTESLSPDISVQEKCDKEAYSEACLRAIDKIRKFSSENYQFKDYLGYFSPYIYRYSGTRESISIRIGEIDRATPVLYSVVYDMLSLIPQYGTYFSAVKLLSDTLLLAIEGNYSFSEIINLSKDALLLAIDKYMPKEHEETWSVIGAAMGLNTIVNTDVSDFDYEHAYSISIELNNHKTVEYIYSDYRFDSFGYEYYHRAADIDTVYIKNENLSTSNGNPNCLLNKLWYSAGLEDGLIDTTLN